MFSRKGEIMSAKEMFKKMGWSYEYVKSDCSEDTIQCKDLTRTMILTCQNDFKNVLPNIQFNLISKCIVVYDLMFININILNAINKQVEELGWNKEIIGGKE